jgi:outer membrane protein OmpA-like peptidoglycan-associated protein
LKLPRNPRRCVPAAAVILAAATIILAGPLACGSKTKQVKPSGPVQTGESQRDAGFIIPLKQQVRWHYGEANPAPSRKPSYLLRSFNFAENGTSLDAEATGVLRDFAKIMAEKPKVRIYVLGLADAYGEKLNADNLGLHRAKVAREFLTSAGVNRERMEMGTIGSAGAVAKEDEKIAMSLDRRVELWLLEE